MRWHVSIEVMAKQISLETLKEMSASSVAPDKKGDQAVDVTLPLI